MVNREAGKAETEHKRARQMVSFKGSRHGMEHISAGSRQQIKHLSCEIRAKFGSKQSNHVHQCSPLPSSPPARPQRRRRPRRQCPRRFQIRPCRIRRRTPRPGTRGRAGNGARDGGPISIRPGTKKTRQLSGAASTHSLLCWHAKQPATPRGHSRCPLLRAASRGLPLRRFWRR